MTIPQPPAGQGPVDPRGAFSPPPAYSAGMGPPPPPMMMMPPPFYPPPPPQRGSFARAVFTTLATSIFGLSIAANIYLLIYSRMLTGGDASRQTTLVSGDSNQKIAVIPITGIITDSTFNRFDKVIRRIEDDSAVKAVVLRVDTIGGEVAASDEIYHRLLLLKERKHIPIVVSMGGYATSGGYYISCAADQIIAEQTTITGNIGVLFSRLDFSKLADKWGVNEESIYPTSAPYKPMGSPFKAMTKQEYDYWLGLVDEAYGIFKTVVQTGRGSRLTASMDVIANGKAYTARESKNMGLVDKIGYAQDAYAMAASLAGLSNMHVVCYEPIPSLLEAFGAESSFAGASQNVQVNGVNVNLDKDLLQDLTTPRIMYLWRGQ